MKIVIDLSWWYTHRVILLAILIITLGVAIAWIGLVTIPDPPPISIEVIQDELNIIKQNDNINDIQKKDMIDEVEEKYKGRDIIFSGKITKFSDNSLYGSYEIEILNKEFKTDSYTTHRILAVCHMNSDSKEFIYSLKLNQSIKVLGSLIYYFNIRNFSWYYQLKQCVEVK